MRKIVLGLCLLPFLYFGCAAQSVQQSGNVTPGHPVRWTTTGVIQDGGAPNAGSLTGIGVTATGNGICQNSGPITSPYNQICLTATATGSALSFFSSSGTGTSQVCVNGNCGSPGTMAGVIVPVTSSAAATVNVSAVNQYFLCLDPTSNAITVNLPSAPALGLSFLIKDCTGQSQVHNITVVPASGNIDNAANFVMNTSLESIAVTFTGVQWSIN